MKYWILATRPKTLAASVAPVLIGSTVAYYDGFFSWPWALLALVGALLIQIGTNFANDYFDFKKGADTAERLGPVRATQAGLISPEHMKRAFIVTFAAACLCGLGLIYRGGWPIAAIGLASVLSGILYTGGPFPLGYWGLGNIFVLIFFGPVAVAGTHYVQALYFSPEALVLGFCVGFISVGLITVNNLRDHVQDKKAGKRTLVVLLGPLWAKIEYSLAILGATCLPILLFQEEHPLLVFLGLFLILAYKPLKGVWTLEGADLNKVLEQTGRLLISYTVLVSVLWIAKINAISWDTLLR